MTQEPDREGSALKGSRVQGADVGATGASRASGRALRTESESRIIERWECPTHGSDIGMASRPSGSDAVSCGHYLPGARRCKTPLVKVEYIPAEALRVQEGR